MGKIALQKSDLLHRNKLSRASKIVFVNFLHVAIGEVSVYTCPRLSFRSFSIQLVAGMFKFIRYGKERFQPLMNKHSLLTADFCQLLW